VPGRAVAKTVGRTWLLAKNWSWRLSLAVVDQGLISGSNFLLSILLAKWMSAEAFGAYALGSLILLAIMSVYHALIFEPMSILAAGLQSTRLRNYTGALLWIHIYLSVAGLLLLAVAHALMHVTGVLPETQNAVIGVAIAAPFVMLFQMLRYSAYLSYDSEVAARAALLYCGALAIGLLATRSVISPAVAYIVMAIASAAASMYLIRRLALNFSRKRTESETTVSGVWRSHFAYGRWVLGSSAVHWVADNCTALMIASAVGVAQLGGYRAVAALLLPSGHIVAAVQRLVQPRLALMYRQRGGRATRTAIVSFSASLAAGTAAFGLVLTTFGDAIFKHLYGGKFSEFEYLLPLLVANAFMWAITQGMTAGLRAIQAPTRVFVVYAASAVVAVASGALAAHFRDLTLIIAASVVCAAVTAVVATVTYLRGSHSPHSDPRSGAALERSTTQETASQVGAG
jgi:O-antigen/teichoic acid export membrane protein